MTKTPEWNAPLTIFSRRQLFSVCLLSVCAAGCTTPWIKKEEENPLAKKTKEVEKILRSDDRPRLIGEAGSMVGLVPRQFEAFGLVINLPLTGGDTKPGEPRDYVIRDLKIRGIDNPNELMRSKTSAVVKLRADCPPGYQHGDRVDLIVQKSMDSEAKDLRNGELMPARLMDFVALSDKKMHQSELKGLANGPIVSIPPSMNSTKQSDPDLGIILGGARLVEEQRIGIRIKDELRHVETAKLISAAINERFDIYDKNVRKGIAVPKSDKNIELSIPSKYRQDIPHFVDVLLSVGFLESTGARTMRLEQCRTQMQSPTTVKSAANQLEAAGKEGIPILKESLTSPDPEIRFYAAYSLAFMDEADAIPILVELSKSESAFRPLTLVGLSVLESPSAEQALRQLLQESEPELCYGALRSLRKRKTYDPVAQGQMLEGLARITEIASSHPLIAVSLTAEPEIATFGGPIQVSLPEYTEVNPRMTMKNENGIIRLAHFRPGKEDLHSAAEPNLRSILQGMRDVQATYSDAIAFLDTAEQSGWIAAPVEFNPIPTPGRKYERNKDAASEMASQETSRAWWDVRRLWSN
jgi:hypothetical protein